MAIMKMILPTFTLFSLHLTALLKIPIKPFTMWYNGEWAYNAPFSVLLLNKCIKMDHKILKLWCSRRTSRNFKRHSQNKCTIVFLTSDIIYLFSDIWAKHPNNSAIEQFTFKDDSQPNTLKLFAMNSYSICPFSTI